MRKEVVMQAENGMNMRIDAIDVARMACGLFDSPMLGKVVKKIRERQGMTQTDLAVKAGLSLSIIQKIEKTGGGTRPTHRAIAEAMGLTLDEFDSLVEKDTVPIQIPRYAYEHAEQQAVKSNLSPIDWIIKRMGLSKRIKVETDMPSAGAAKQRRVRDARPLESPVKDPQK